MKINVIKIWYDIFLCEDEDNNSFFVFRKYVAEKYTYYIVPDNYEIDEALRMTEKFVDSVSRIDMEQYSLKWEVPMQYVSLAISLIRATRKSFPEVKK